jgi:AmiR/NasT family two-component response regulator
VANQFQQAVQSRAVIEQAKGILMGNVGVTRRRPSTCSCGSQDTNRKLRHVAEALVAEAVVRER